MHQTQTEYYQEIEQQMINIRKTAVETEAIENSMKQFAHSIDQAYQQTFGHLDLDKKE